jgi:hypothetical protein
MELFPACRPRRLPTRAVRHTSSPRQVAIHHRGVHRVSGDGQQLAHDAQFSQRSVPLRRCGAARESVEHIDVPSWHRHIQHSVSHTIRSAARATTAASGASANRSRPGSIRSTRRAAVAVAVQWHGSNALTLTYKDGDGRLGESIIYREREPELKVTTMAAAQPFDSDPAAFRLAAEALRIRMAARFDPMLTISTSDLDALPHQGASLDGAVLGDDHGPTIRMPIDGVAALCAHVDEAKRLDNTGDLASRQVRERRAHAAPGT